MIRLSPKKGAQERKLPFIIVEGVFRQWDEGFAQRFWKRAPTDSDSEPVMTLQRYLVRLFDKISKTYCNVVCVSESIQSWHGRLSALRRPDSENFWMERQ